MRTNELIEGEVGRVSIEMVGLTMVLSTALSRAGRVGGEVRETV